MFFCASFCLHPTALPPPGPSPPFHYFVSCLRTLLKPALARRSIEYRSKQIFSFEVASTAVYEPPSQYARMHMWLFIHSKAGH